MTVSGQGLRRPLISKAPVLRVKTSDEAAGLIRYPGWHGADEPIRAMGLNRPGCTKRLIKLSP